MRRVLRSHGAGITFALSQLLRDLVGGAAKHPVVGLCPYSVLSQKGHQGSWRTQMGPGTSSGWSPWWLSVSCVRYRQGQADLAHWLRWGHHWSCIVAQSTPQSTISWWYEQGYIDSSDDHFVTEDQLLLLLQHMLHFCPQLLIAPTRCWMQAQFTAVTTEQHKCCLSGIHSFPGCASFLRRRRVFEARLRWVAATATRGRLWATEAQGEWRPSAGELQSPLLGATLLLELLNLDSKDIFIMWVG